MKNLEVTHIMYYAESKMCENECIFFHSHLKKNLFISTNTSFKFPPGLRNFLCIKAFQNGVPKQTHTNHNILQNEGNSK